VRTPWESVTIRRPGPLIRVTANDGRNADTIEPRDPSAAEQLLPPVYAELWKLAAAKLA
jgi:hypothetical protein